MTLRVVAAAVVAATLAGCAHHIAGTPTWPGARLDKVLLSAADFPPGVQYERITEGAGEPEGGLTAPSMVSKPAGCSDGLTRVIADSGERGPGSAAEYLVGYDGARMVITVLTWPLDLDRLAATAERCARFETFFDPSEPGIPITTTKVAAPRAQALVYQQTMRLGDVDNSVYFSFENVGPMAVFGVAFPTPNPTVPVKGPLPQTFLDLTTKQAQRIEAA